MNLGCIVNLVANIKHNRMGFSIYIYSDNDDTLYIGDYLPILNLTYNYSRPECMKYWYGPNDMHNKTVEEVIQNMERAILNMIKDGIEIGDCFVKDDIGGFLSYIIRQYRGFSKMPRDWKVEIK